MPLDKSGSMKSIGKNIKTEKKAHPSMKKDQAVAIALNVAREHGAKITKKKGK